MSAPASYPHLSHQHVHHHDPLAAAMALRDDDRAEAQTAESRALQRSRLHAIGRVALSMLFLTSALAKLIHFDDTRRAIEDFGLSAPEIFVAIAIGIELVGGTMIALGYRTRRAAIGLSAYLAILTLLTSHDLSVELNRSVAIATLAIIGGLLLLAAQGGGTFSLDTYLGNRERAQFA
jgi:putative oxidoreductase